MVRVYNGELWRCIVNKGMVLIVVLVVLMAASGYAQTSDYIPKANEELYGTWTNENMSPQKTVNFAGGCKDFDLLSDSVSFGGGTEQIASTWKDSEGNIWYKTFDKGTAGGAYAGYKWQALQKLSKSGTVREFEVKRVSEFDPNSYPTRVDAKDSSYKIYYRAKK
jgi:opacity protein-like surface antigen